MIDVRAIVSNSGRNEISKGEFDPDTGNANMCDKCAAIDEKIWRYRRVARQIDNKQIDEVADRLAERLDAQKQAFHAS